MYMSVASDHNRVKSIIRQMSHLSGIREQQEGDEGKGRTVGGGDLKAVLRVLIMDR